ncbi:O-methyltransferase [Fodinicola feengrottensis]|uniref:O-methyltransferase n=1 Tax=Fodinicola feengrottensis TaxID=435914 RepID=A0ABN2IY70_9ACTN|nr:class I SAM-dependent methyltransferase [Fodinicola feengrottensis]
MKPVTLPGIEDYVAAHTTPDAPHLVELAAQAHEALVDPQMMSGPVQGRFLELLVFAMRPRLVLEIGTFSGYSALSMAPALPPGGRIVTCELNPEHATFARKRIAENGFADRITVEEGPALDTVRSLDGPFDLAFIDANKTGYPDYLEAVLEKLSPNGLMLADNTLWNGDVLNADSADPDTHALRSFNAAVAADPRLRCTLLTVRDGLTVIRRA